MIEPNLHALQADFAAALTARDPGAHPKGLDREEAARFRIYRNNYLHGLSQQLAESYPVVRRLVGDAFFFAMAREYLWERAPRTRPLALFGQELPEFLRHFPPVASLAYLPDVALLERARLEALHAADAAPLTSADLSGAGRWLGIDRFVAHPATRIVTSDYPIVNLWRAHQPEMDPRGRSFTAVSQSALITRPQLRVEVRQLSPAESAFARRLLERENAHSAGERPPEANDEFVETGAFCKLLAAGAIARPDSVASDQKDHNGGG
jgi:hypothetical protein